MESTLDVHSWVVMATFVVVILLVIRPLHIPLPNIQITCSRRRHSKDPSNNLTIDTDPESQHPSNTADETDTDTVANCSERDRVQSNQHSTFSTVAPTVPTNDDNTLAIPIGRPPSMDRALSLSSLPRVQAQDTDGFIHKSRRAFYIPLNMASAPVLGVLLLLATSSINWDSIHNGIVGAPESGIEPYDVMILFYSLAYICISLDMTGIFQYAAFWISRRGGGGGQRIFLSFFLLSTIMSGLTSNDVVILTMTPFLVYFSLAVGLETPTAFLMAEIQSANIASMALYIGNITNVIVCQAYKISFVEYSAWMILPCLASVAACYIMLRIVFRGERYIPATVKIPDVDPRSHLVDPSGAKFGMAMLACSIGCLIGTSFAHVPVWIVTGPFALLAFARDLWSDWRRNGPVGVNSSVLSRPDQESVTDMQIDPTDSIEIGQCSSVEVVETSKLPYVRDPSREASWDISGSKESLSIELANLRSSPLVSVQNECNVSVHSMPNAVPATDSTSIHHAGIRDVSTVTLPVSNPSVKEPGALRRRFPLTREILVRMPWSILPFTLSMFIIVEGMSSTGWIGLFASWFARLIPNYIVAVYAVGLVAVLLCNIFNNVPMTILVARILLHPNFADSPLATPKVVKGCLFALVIASNLGACTTLISSLAGLMWDSVLRNKRSNVGFWNFLRWNMAVMPVVIISALSVVIVELTVIY